MPGGFAWSHAEQISAADTFQLRHALERFVAGPAALALTEAMARELRAEVVFAG